MLSMSDYESIKECFDELAAAVLGGLRGAYDRRLLEEVQKLVCSEKFVPSQGLKLFLEEMPVEVDCLRKKDPVVDAYFQLEKKFRQIQLERKVSQHKREKTQLSKTKRDELQAAKEKAAQCVWNLLLDRGIQNQVVVDAMALPSDGTVVNLKRCLQLHAFAYDLHASLKMVQADSKQNVSKKSFEDTLRHCIVTVSQPYFCVIPVSMRPLIMTSVEPEVRAPHEAPEASDKDEEMPDCSDPDEAVQRDEDMPAANPLVGKPKSFTAAWESFRKRVGVADVDVSKGAADFGSECIALFVVEIGDNDLCVASKAPAKNFLRGSARSARLLSTCLRWRSSTRICS